MPKHTNDKSATNSASKRIRIAAIQADQDAKLESDAILQQDARALAHLGYAKFKANDFEAASRILRQAIQFDRCNVSALTTLAEIANRLDKYPDAIILLNKVITLQPTNVDALTLRGEVLNTQTIYADALNDTQAALKLKPNHARALRCLSDIQCRTNNFEAAMTTINTCLTHYPDDPFALRRRASIHHKQGNLVAALADIDPAIALAPGVIASFRIRVNINFALNKMDAALADINEMLKLAPNDLEIGLKRDQLHNALSARAFTQPLPPKNNTPHAQAKSTITPTMKNTALPRLHPSLFAKTPIKQPPMVPTKKAALQPQPPHRATFWQLKNTMPHAQGDLPAPRQPIDHSDQTMELDPHFGKTVAHATPMPRNNAEATLSSISQEVEPMRTPSPKR